MIAVRAGAASLLWGTRAEIWRPAAAPPSQPSRRTLDQALAQALAAPPMWQDTPGQGGHQVLQLPLFDRIRTQLACWIAPR